MSNDKAIVPYGPSDPVGNAIAIRDVFEKAKTSLLRECDVMKIPSKQGVKTYITRSGWRLMATAFNISDEIVSRELTNTTCIYTVKAVAPNGRSAIGVGAAETPNKNQGGCSDAVPR
jgi:hypothetical protein